MAVYNLGAGDLHMSLQIAQLVAAFGGIALYNVVELLLLIAVTFCRRKGLYFWSLIVSTVAIVPYTLGLLFKFFGVINVTMLLITLIDIGWQCMVTGQSVVLYSRLHLVTSTRWKIRFVLGMIILNFFVSNVPTTIFVFASASSHAGPFLKPYAFWERFQLCCYFAQETIISGLYVYEIASLLKIESHSDVLPTEESNSTDQAASVVTAPSQKIVKKGPRGRRVLRQLIYVNVIIVILDATLLAIEFIGHYEIQVLYKVSPAMCEFAPAMILTCAGHCLQCEAEARVPHP